MKNRAYDLAGLKTRIDRIMVHQNITPKFLAESCGMESKRFMHRFTCIPIDEDPNISELVRVCDALGISLDYAVKGIKHNGYNETKDTCV